MAKRIRHVSDWVEQTEALSVTDAPSADRPYWIVEGLAGRYDYLNRNQRVYPRHVVDEAVNALKAEGGLIDRKMLFCEVDHPQPDTAGERRALIRNTAGVVTDMWTGEPDGGEGGPIYFKAHIADNENGRQIVSLIRAGARMGASTRGMGPFEIKKTNEGVRAAYAAPGFRYSGLDWVANPSVVDAGIDAVEDEDVAEEPVQDTQNRTEASSPELSAANLAAIDTVLASFTTLIQNFAADQNWYDIQMLADFAASVNSLSWREKYDLRCSAMAEPEDAEKTAEPTNENQLQPLCEKLAAAAEGFITMLKNRHDAAEAAKAEEAEKTAADAGAEQAVENQIPAEDAKSQPETTVEHEVIAEFRSVLEATQTQLTEAVGRVEALEGVNRDLNLKLAILEHVQGEPRAMALYNKMLKLCRSVEEIDDRLEDAKVLVEAQLARVATQTEAKTVTAVAESDEETSTEESAPIQDQKRKWTPAQREQYKVKHGHYPD